MNAPHSIRSRLVATQLVVTALCALSVGCNSAQSFTDTEGRTFAAECKDDHCEYRLAPAASSSEAGKTPPPASSSPTVALRSTGHLLAVCDSPNGNAADCRAVTCKGKCPSTADGQSFTCERGLCVSGADLTRDDVLLLCLAGTGIKRNARQAARMALAHSCGTPCQVPAACRQP